MRTKYLVPFNMPQKPTKHGWWIYRWLEERATLGACRTARMQHKGVINHELVALWEEQIARAFAQYNDL